MNTEWYRLHKHGQFKIFCYSEGFISNTNLKGGIYLYKSLININEVFYV